MRINKYLSSCGFGSRRKVEELIKNGEVFINGQKAVLTDLVDSFSVVSVRGKKVSPENKFYYAFNKPKGVISSNFEKFAKTTVADFFDEKSIFICGRLDKDSHGLMILTNDGDFTYKLTHPSFEHEKEYLVQARTSGKDLSEKFAYAIKLFKCGHVLDGKKIAPASIKMISQDGGRAEFLIILTQGVKRQIRRTFEKAGIKVLDLNRTRIGKFCLRNLKEGEYRKISPIEVI